MHLSYKRGGGGGGGGSSTPATYVSSWTFVDGNTANGINHNPAGIVAAPQLTVSGSKLYTTWQENNGTTYQIRVAVYNGNDAAPTWTFVDGHTTNGINHDSTKDAVEPQLTAFGNELYATWEENNGTAYQIRVAAGHQ